MGRPIVFRVILLIFCYSILMSNVFTIVLRDRSMISSLVDGDDNFVLRAKKPSYKYKCEDTIDIVLGKINPDPSPLNTTLVSTIVSLLQNFAALSSGMGHPWTEGKLENYMRVLKMELFTLQTNNHFILPVGKAETERFLNNKMKTFTARWYDLGQAPDADKELHMEMQKVVKNFMSLGKTLTIENLYKRLLQNYAIVNEPQAPLTIGATIPQPNVRFPLADLMEDGVIIHEEGVAEWINNFKIRKFLIHELFLLKAKKPRKVAFDFRERLSTYDALVRAIIEIAPRWKTLRCTYTGVLNEFAKNFEARKYPQELMENFKHRLVEVFNADVQLTEDLQSRYTEIMAKEHNNTSSKLLEVYWPIKG